MITGTLHISWDCSRNNDSGWNTDKIVEGNWGIASPNYPNEYPNNVSCKWSIRDLSGGKIELNIYDIQTEVCRSSLDPSKSCNEPCRYDYLEIHDGNSSQMGDRLCGNITGLYRKENNSTSSFHHHPSPLFPLKTVVSFTDNLDLYWRSDESISSKGFKISVKTNGK